MRMPTVRRPRYADIASTLALVVAMGGTAYATATIGTADIKNGAVTTAKLHDGAVRTGKIHFEGVTRAKLAADAVTGSKVANQSLTLSDLRGIDVTGPISFSFSANSCGTLNFGVSGAAAGQAAFLTWTGTGPATRVMGPLKVVSATSVTALACNVGGSSLTMTDVGIRLVTVG